MAKITSAYRAGSADQRPGWRVAFTYDPDTIAALKNIVPARDREWHAEQKEWWVAESFEGTLTRLLPGFEAYLAQGQLL